jgi:hypothetical protein
MEPTGVPVVGILGADAELVASYRDGSYRGDVVAAMADVF